MKNSPEPLKNTYVSIRFQMIVGLGLTILMIGIVMARRYVFDSLNPAPKILTITPKTLERFKRSPVAINTGLIIKDFQSLEIINNEFIFSGVLWFELEPGSIALSTLEKFTFERGEILYRSPPETKLINEKLLIRYNIKVRFSSPIDYSRFPIDDHRLFLVLSHRFVTPDELTFESLGKTFIVKANLENTGWILLDTNVKSGYKEIELDAHDKSKLIYYPAVVYSMDFTRYGMRYFLSIFLPLFVLIRLVFLAFSMSPINGFKVSTVAATGILAYRFIIEQMSPNTGYFMISDYFFFIFLGTSLLFFLVNILEITTNRVTRLHKEIILVLVNLAISTICTYLLLFY